MRNNSLILVAILVLFAGGVGVYAFMNREAAMVEPNPIDKAVMMGSIEEMEKTEETGMVKDDSAMMVKDEQAVSSAEDAMMKEDGKYLPFSSEVLANAVATRRVLFFYANWCPTCKPADDSFSKNAAEIPSDVTVIRVNYNDTDTDQSEKDLAKKYGVTYQHTFVQIDENGKEVTKWNGGQINELLSNIQ